ncbi:DUF1534 domain-containing protein [Pseudomonas congelans]|nr:DUF1534 domain-containing protein [Pseudomonas congelans]
MRRFCLVSPPPPGHLSFLTLQRGNAVLDALRPILNMRCGPNL